MMSIKYYTHFLLQEPSPGHTSEYRGVIELNRALSSGYPANIPSILAKNFECDAQAIKVLQWSRLH